MFLYRKTHAQRQYSCTVYMLVAVLSRTWLREEVESIHPASYGIRESDLRLVRSQTRLITTALVHRLDGA